MWEVDDWLPGIPNGAAGRVLSRWSLDLESNALTNTPQVIPRISDERGKWMIKGSSDNWTNKQPICRIPYGTADWGSNWWPLQPHFNTLTVTPWGTSQKTSKVECEKWLFEGSCYKRTKNANVQDSQRCSRSGFERVISWSTFQHPNHYTLGNLPETIQRWTREVDDRRELRQPTTGPKNTHQSIGQVSPPRLTQSQSIKEWELSEVLFRSGLLSQGPSIICQRWQ